MPGKTGLWGSFRQLRPHGEDHHITHTQLPELALYASPTAVVAASMPVLATACRQRVPSCQQVFSSAGISIARAQHAQCCRQSGGIDVHTSSSRWHGWLVLWARRQSAPRCRWLRWVARKRSRPISSPRVAPAAEAHLRRAGAGEVGVWRPHVH